MTKKTILAMMLLIFMVFFMTSYKANTEIIFFDDFENIDDGDYPEENGWINITSGKTAYVSTEQARSGVKSFRLEGTLLVGPLGCCSYFSSRRSYL
jgi:hypothetical protein